MAVQYIRDVDNALRELAAQAGALVKIVQQGSRHRRAIFSYNGRSRFTTLSSSPRNSNVHVVRKQAKHTLRSLGAPL